ncbi:hypothetical protein BH20CHL6_BH20CHL6_07670 [soil metagenome]
MSDIIPRASSGRYMGISNVASGLRSTTLPALLLGVLVTGVALAAGGADSPQGPRLAVAAALPLFLLGVLALRPFDERRRKDPTAPVPALG